MSVVEWLESPEGEKWSRQVHRLSGYGRLLVMVKDDDGTGGMLIWTV